MERKTVKIQNINIDTFSKSEALNWALKSHGQVVTLNPEMIMYSRKNSNFRDILNKSELVIPDGIGVEIGLKILGYNVKRIAGIEFSHNLIEKFNEQNLSVAVLGAKPEVIELVIQNLKKEFPTLNIVYVQNGYFTNEESVKEGLIQSGAKLVLVALGSPKQEIFINSLKSKMSETLFIGVGGSFDVWSGLVERAPEIWQKLGLEWLYRTVKEPKRFKRIFPTLPLFVLYVLKERLCNA